MTSTTNNQSPNKPSCPQCGQRGKRVKPITLQSLLTDNAIARLQYMEGFYFCATVGCEVAYYQHGSDETLNVSDVRIPIGQKQTEMSRNICYCFDHTAEEIEAEIAATGTTSIVDDIKTKCKQGLDRCAQTNPQGSCCLGNVQAVVKQAQAEFAGQMDSDKSIGAAACCCSGKGQPDDSEADANQDCCSDEHNDDKGSHVTGKVGAMATGGAVVAAVLSSACCWLPLLLIVFGVSATGISGFFESYRLYFLIVTTLMLAVAFYLAYRPPRCKPGSTCEVTDLRLRRLNRGMLWVATVFVIGFALFPYYRPSLVRAVTSQQVSQVSDSGGSVTPETLETYHYQIDGMTCQGCAAGVEAKVFQIPGIRSAKVSYEDATAVVQAYPPQFDSAALLNVVESLGFHAQIISQESDMSGQISRNKEKD